MEVRRREGGRDGVREEGREGWIQMEGRRDGGGGGEGRAERKVKDHTSKYMYT